jgi:hypothetical protein
MLVEPFYTRSKIGQNEKTAQNALKAYAVQRQRAKEAVQKGVEHGDDPQMVAESVCRALATNSPRMRYPVGKGIFLSRLRRFAPAGVFDRGVRKASQLN